MRLLFVMPALMDLHPARTFFRTIERIKKFSFKPTSISSVYDFVYGDLRFAEQGKEYTISKAYKRGNDFTQDQISDALKSKIFRPSKKWIHYVFCRQAKDVRFNSPLFMTQLVDGPGLLSDCFFKLIRRIGTPFFSDAKFNGGFGPPVCKKFPNATGLSILSV